MARFPVPKEKFIALFEEEKVSSSEEGFALIEDVRRSEQTGIPSSGTTKVRKLCVTKNRSYLIRKSLHYPNVFGGFQIRFSL